MSEIKGKWIQVEGQPYEGLWFDFKSDGSFEAQYEPMGIVSSGSYAVEDGEITMQQTAHTLGFVGEFKGLFEVDGNMLKNGYCGRSRARSPCESFEITHL